MFAKSTLFIAVLAVAGEPPVYKVTRGYAPVRLSYDDLYSVIETVRVLARSSNADFAPPKYSSEPSESLEVGHRSTSVTFPSGFDAQDLKRAPPVADKVEYSYTHARGAPITSVDVSLRDYSRNVSVKGTVPEQVDAMLAAIDARLAPHEAHLTGPGMRSWGGLLLVTLSLVLLGLPLAFISKASRSEVRRYGRTMWIMFTTGVGSFAMMVLPTWEEVLPGTGVFAGSTSFMVRHNAEITALGTGLTLLLGLPTAASLLLRFFRGPSANDVDKDEKPGNLPEAKSEYEAPAGETSAPKPPPEPEA